MTESTLKYAISKNTENLLSCKNLYTSVHSSIIYRTTQKKKEPTRYPSIDGQISKISYDCKKEQSTASITWANLENFLLSKRNQTKRATCDMIPFI